MIDKIIFNFISFNFYKKLNKYLNKIQDSKNAQNSTELYHVLSTLILGFIFIFNSEYSYLIQYNSGGYFIYDSYYIIKQNNYNKIRIMYLYHHLTCFLYILLDANSYYWPHIMVVAELSNLPNKIVYYHLQIDKKNESNIKSNDTLFAMRVQLYSYFFLRIIILGYFGLLELQNKEVHPFIYMTSVLYVFGVLWFTVMLKQNYNLNNIKLFQ